MPRTLALHFEMKRRNGRIDDAGPGDTLRLVHSLAPYRAGGVDILTTSSLSRIKGLFATRGTAPGPDVWVEGNTRWMAVKKEGLRAPLLAAFLGRAERAHALDWADYRPEVVHAYIGDPRRGAASVLVRGKRIAHRRIDIAACRTGTLSIPGFAPRGRDDKTLAVHLRVMPSGSRRDTPRWFVRDVRAVVKDLAVRDGIPWRIVWYGFGSSVDVARIGLERGHLAPDESTFEYEGESYIEQMKRLAGYDLATGVNTGGLDLAAAAGIPILRVGEFQGGGPEEDTAAVRARMNWGPRYNRFLARATTVGLKPPLEALDQFDRATFRRTLRVMLKHLTDFSLPRHVVLPLRVALSERRVERRRQLVDNEPD